MLGRLASDFIVEAGKPQLIYTVPDGKVLNGGMVVYNGSQGAGIVQIKRGAGLEAPAASYPFSNANQISNGVRPGQIMLDLGGAGLVSADGNGSYRPDLFDLSDPVSPVAVVRADQGFPRTPYAWEVAGRLCIRDGTSLRRYAGSVTPWTLGSYGSVEGGTYQAVSNTAAGWDQYAAAAGMAQGTLVYTTSLSTSGTVNWQELTFAAAGLEAIHSSYYTSETYIDMQVANGVFFFAYPSTNGYQYHRFAVTDAVNVGSAWTNVFGNWSTSNYHNWRIFYANGKYWLFHYRTGNYFDWFSIDASNLFTQTNQPNPHAFASGSVQYNIYGTNASSYLESMLQLADGTIVWRASNGWYQLDPVANTVLPWISSVGDHTIPENYTNFAGSKLSKVDIGDVYHTVPIAGATDPANQRIAYTQNGIFEFVDDPTWSLADIGDHAGWMTRDTSLNDKAELEHNRRMFNAGDQIWFRSTRAGVTISVEGYLIDVAA